MSEVHLFLFLLLEIYGNIQQNSKTACLKLIKNIWNLFPPDRIWCKQFYRDNINKYLRE